MGHDEATAIFLSPNTTEVVKGYNHTNGVARFYSNQSNVVTFKYTVVKGDVVSLLDVVSINFVDGYIRGRYTNENVSTEVPIFGIGPRYMTSGASSLSYNQKVQVTSKTPSVIAVHSPNVSGVYTAGDRVFIDIEFDLDVSLQDPEFMTLAMATGVFSRQVPYFSFLDSRVVRFLYIVQPLDVSPALDCVSATALSLNEAMIFRDTGSQIINAEITLPQPGSANSLSMNKLVIDTTAPVAITLFTTSPPGNYTAGDYIDFLITYNTKVAVTGTPRFLLANTPRQLQAEIRTLPFLPDYSFERTFAGENVQIKVNISLNWDLQAGDEIGLYLPRLFINSPPPPATTRPMSLIVTSVDLPANMIGSAIWNDVTKELRITLSDDLPRYAPLDFFIQGKSGLFVDADGIRAPVVERIRVYSNDISAAYTDNFTPHHVDSVGVSAVTFQATPYEYDVPLSLVMTVSTPEYIERNDSFTFHLADFPAQHANVAQVVTASTNSHWNPNVTFYTVWNGATGDLTLIYSGKYQGLTSFKVNLTNAYGNEWNLPQNGLTDGSVRFSMVSARNGLLNRVTVTDPPRACSAPADGRIVVRYLGQSPGVASDILLRFPTGLNGLNAGDRIVFQLPNTINSAIFSSSIPPDYYSNSNVFQLSLQPASQQLTLTALSDLAADQSVEILLNKAVGVSAPTTGVIENVHFFYFHVISAGCRMNQPRKIFYQFPYLDDDVSQGAGNQILSLRNARMTFANSPSFGSRVNGLELSVHFSNYLAGNPLEFQPGDFFFVSLPHFQKNFTLETFDNPFLSAADLQVTWNPVEERMEYQFLSSFKPSDHNNHLIVNITSAAALYFPETDSIPNTPPPFKLSIFSANFGNLVDHPFSLPWGYNGEGFCIGFCEATVEYSTHLLQQPLSMLVNFSYQHSWAGANPQVTLAVGNQIAAAGHLGSAIAVVARLFSLSQGRFLRFIPTSLSYSSVSRQLTVSLLSSNITNRQLVSLEVSGFYFSSMAPDPTGAGIAENYLSLVYSDNTHYFRHPLAVRASLPYPSTLFYSPVMKFANATIIRDGHNSTHNQIAFHFLMNRQYALTAANYLVLNSLQLVTPASLSADIVFLDDPAILPLVRVASSSDRSIVDLTQSFYQRSSKQLLVRFSDRLNYTNEFSIALFAFQFQNQNDAGNLTYRIGYLDDRWPADDSKLLSGPVAYTQVEEIPTILSNKIEFTSRNSSNYNQILELMMTVSLSVPVEVLSPGTKLIVQTGFFSSALPVSAGSIHMVQLGNQEVASNVVNPNVTYFVDKVHQKQFFEITLTSNQLTLPDNPNDLIFLLTTSQLLLELETDQSGGNNEVRTTLYDELGREVSDYLNAVPCVGVCAATLTPSVRNPGRSSAYFFNLSLAYVPNLRSVQFALDLHSFTPRPSVLAKNHSMFIKCWDTQLSSPSASRWTAVALWQRNDSYLIVNVRNMTVADSNAPLNISCLLPAEFYLVQPMTGVRLGDNLFSMATRFTAVTGPEHVHQTPVVYEFVNDVAVANIGGIRHANLTTEPSRANSAVAMQIDLSFHDQLSAGDSILIYLPGYAIPSLPIACDVTLEQPIAGITTVAALRGVAARQIPERNLDNSQYFLNQTGYIKVSILHDIAAHNGLSIFIDAAVGIISPALGTYSAALPIINVISQTSPIAGVSFQSIPKYSTLDPSSWQLDVQQTTAANVTTFLPTLRVSFQSYCTMLANDSILVYLPNIRFNGGHTKVEFAHVFSLNGVASPHYNWSASFSETDPHVLVIRLIDGYIPSVQPRFTQLSFAIQLFSHVDYLTDLIVYENDASVFYEFLSDLCPVPATSFQTSNYFNLKYSRLEYPVLDWQDNITLPARFRPGSLHNKPVYSLTFFFLPTKNVPARGGPGHNETILRLVLDNIVTYPESPCNRSSYASEAEECRVNVNGALTTPAGLFETKAHVTTHFNRSSGFMQTTIDFVLSRSLYQGEVITVSTLVSSQFLNSSEFRNSPLDIIGFQQHNISTEEFASSVVLFHENVATNAPGHTVLMRGPVDQVKIPLNIERILFEIDNPVAGEVSAITIRLQLSNDFTLDQSTVLSLPGFALANPSLASWVYRSDDLSQQFQLTWDAADETLRITPLIKVSAHFETTILIDAAQGLQTPQRGIPVPDAVNRVAVVVTQSNRELASREFKTITPVPYLIESSLEFISSLEPVSFAYNGIDTSIQLAPGHEFTEEDVGAQVIIDGGLYTISGLFQENVLTILEPYQGRRVVTGEPELPIFTPPFRSAFYLNGTGSSKLFFHYLVRRGDNMQSLALYSTTPNSFAIDLYGGSMLRFSDTPIIPINLAIPNLISSSHRLVNTEYPRVVEVSTTSPAGSYAVGQIIDIHVKFSFAVTLEIIPPAPSPRLSLFLSSGRTNATYVTGSKTTTLVFFYTVRHYDYDTAIAKRIIEEDEIFQQPLRIIQGNTYTTLQRSAYGEFPILDASLDLDAAAFSFPSHMEIIGHTAQVVSITVPSKGVLSDFVYGAGELIDIFVTFDQAVYVNTTQADPRGSSFFYLDVGRAQPGVASFAYQYNATTLVYSYLVTLQDKLTTGLMLHCTCSDYLQRTFLRLATHTQIMTAAIHQPVSLILAGDSSLDSLQIDEQVSVDNQIPVVTRVVTNATDGVYGPGDRILVSVQFSTPVELLGIATLLLRGQNTACRAPYFSGNRTNTLSFLYSVSFRSGTARLDCDSVDALQLDLGVIYRRAFYPTIPSVNALPLPGTLHSLGRKNAILIDVFDNAVTGVQLADRNEENAPYFAPHQIDVNVPKPSLLDLVPNLLSKYCDVQYFLDQRKVYQLMHDYREDYQSLGVDLLVENITWGNYSNRLNQSINQKEYDYYSILSSDLSFPLLYDLPDYPYTNVQELIASCFNWWNSLYLSPSLDFYLQWDRNITQNGLKVRLNTATNFATEQPLLNSAFASSQDKLYYLRVQRPTYPTTDGYFVFKYNGRLSRCLTLTHSTSSYLFLQEVLLDLPELHTFVPLVQMTKANAEFTEFSIQFNRFLEYPLEVLSGESELADLCPIPALATAVTLYTRKDLLPVSYPIRPKNSLVLKVKETLPTGSFQLTLRRVPFNQNFTVKGRSFLFEHFDPDERLLGKTIVQHTSSLPKIMRSEVIFGSPPSSLLASAGHPALPGGNTTFQVNLCLSLPWQVGDEVVVRLPDFNLSNPSLSFLPASRSGVSLHWNASTSSLLIEILATNLQNNCINLYKLFGNQFHYISLPTTIIYGNDKDFSFTIRRLDPHNPHEKMPLIQHKPFQVVSGVGFQSFSISFNDSRPYFPTDIVLNFELLQEIAVGTDSILLYLPGFYSPDAQNSQVRVRFPFDKHLQAHWSNHTQTLAISTLNPLLKGVYEIVLTSDVSPFVFPKIGLSLLDPPQIQIQSPAPSLWSCDLTVLEEYPVIYGYHHLSADVQLTNQTLEINSISISVDWSQPVDGPMQILVQLPFVSYALDFYENLEPAAVSSSELALDRFQYYAENHTFVLWKTAPFTTTDQVVTFRIANLTGFYLNSSYGIASNTTVDQAYFSLFTAVGRLDYTPLRLFPIIPAITFSSIELTVLERDVFMTKVKNSYENILVSLRSNVFLAALNYFELLVNSNYLSLDFSEARIVNSVCYNVTSQGTVGNFSVVMITATNESHACRYHRHKETSWNITNVRVINDNSNGTTQFLRLHQFSNPNELFALSWHNNHFDVDYQPFTRTPFLGIYSARILFDNPYRLEKTNMTVEVYLATLLRKGDLIRISVPHLIVQFPARRRFLPIHDQHGRNWTFRYSPDSGELVYVVPIDLYGKSFLRFQMPVADCPIILPSRGIPFNALPFLTDKRVLNKFNLNSSAINASPHLYSIGFSRDANFIQKEVIASVTPVGKIESFRLELLRVSGRGEFVLSLDLLTLSSLFAYDEIVLTFQHDYFSFLVDYSFPLSPEDAQLFQVKATAANQLVITLWDKMDSPQLLLRSQVTAPGDIRVSDGQVNRQRWNCSAASPAACDLSVEIKSFSNPVRSYFSNIPSLHFLDSLTSLQFLTTFSDRDEYLSAAGQFINTTQDNLVNQLALRFALTGSIPAGLSIFLDITDALDTAVTAASAGHTWITTDRPQDWEAAWAQNQTDQRYWIRLTARSAIANQSLTQAAHSLSVYFNDSRWSHGNCLYSDDLAVPYKIVGPHSNLTYDAGAITRVDGLGLKDATLVLHRNQTTVQGKEFWSYSPALSSLSVKLLPLAQFLANERLTVHLPGILKASPSPSVVLDRTDGSSSSTYSLVWDGSFEVLNISVLAPVSRIEFSLRPTPAGVQFSLPWDGLNQFDNAPAVTFFHRTNHFGQLTLYGPAPFRNFRGVSAKIEANLSFPTALPGQSSPVQIELTTPQPIHLAAGDTLSFFLPQFSSDYSSFSLDSDQGDLTADWIACEERLVLTVSAAFDLAGTWTIVVRSLLLPHNGIGRDLLAILAATVTSANYEEVPLIFSQVQRVGKIYDTRLVLGGQQPIGQPSEVMVELRVSEDLHPADLLVLTIPETAVTQAVCEVVGNHSFARYNASRPGYEAVHNSSALVLAAHQFIARDSLIRLNLSACLAVSARGFPEFPRDQYTLTIRPHRPSSPVYGQQPFQLVSPVGLLSLKVFYTSSDQQDQLNRLRLELSFSYALRPFDSVVVSLPLLNSSARSLRGLPFTGDFYENGQGLEKIFFLGDWDADSQTITLSCRQHLPVRPLSIFLERPHLSPFRLIAQNNLLLTGGAAIVHPADDLYAHRMVSANISDNLLAAQPANYYAVDTSFVRGLDLTLSGCDRFHYCDLSLWFRSFHNLTAGSLLVLSHEHLGNELGELFDAHWQAADFDNFTAVGVRAEAFQLLYRTADNYPRNLSLLAHSLELAAVRDLADQDQLTAQALVAGMAPVKQLDLSLDPFFLDLQLPAAVVSSALPRIVSVEVVEGVGAAQFPTAMLFCGDELFLRISFTAPVFVRDNGRARLLLNSKEFAHFLGGNGTDQLLFKYSVAHPFRVPQLAVDGPGALSMFSFDNIFALPDPAAPAHAQLVPANLTLPEPYGLTVTDRLRGGVVESLLVDCNRTASAVAVYAYSGANRDYANGDVLDIAVLFDRPVQAVGASSLTFLDHGPGHAATSFTAHYVNVSAVQLLSFDTAGLFQLLYLGQASPCLPSDDAAAIFLALRNLAGLEESFPAAVQPVAEPGRAFSYEISFGGIAPAPVRVLADYCPSPRAVGLAHLPEEMRNQLVYRYEVRNLTDLHGNLTYAPATAIQLAATTSRVSVVLPLATRAADLTLPDPNGPGGLRTSRVRINNQRPFVTAVYSNWSAVHPSRSYAVSGEAVEITVEWSCPVLVVNGPGNIFLPLNVTNLILAAQNASAEVVHQRNVSFVGAEGNRMRFVYPIAQGDVTAHFLATPAAASVVLADPSARILRASRTPFAEADPLLPAPDAPNGLAASQIVVRATELPLVLRAYTPSANYDPAQPPGRKMISATAGTSVDILVELSAAVTIEPHSPDRRPFIEFLTPTNGLDYYAANMTLLGTEADGRVLRFRWLVEENFAPGNVSFRFELQWAHLLDGLGQRFNNLTNALAHVPVAPGVFVVDNLAVDTRVPRVLRVDCANPDGVYHAGEVLDIFLVWDKPVLVLLPTPAARPPQLKLFVQTELPLNSLADYSHGNGTSRLHFRYVVPAPNINRPRMADLLLDYAAAEALLFHLNGALITDVSPAPQTRAEVLLPIFHHSFLKYRRAVLVDVNFPELLGLFAARNGSYTAGDLLTVGLRFTSAVMVPTPPPVLLLDTGATSSGVAASFVGGNGTAELLFAHRVTPADGLPGGRAVDYIDTRRRPYATSSLDRSLPLVAWDDFLAGHFQAPAAGVFMNSSDLLVGLPTSLPPPGEPGSLSATSAVFLDTARPSVRLVTTTAPSGTYNSLTRLNVSVSFTTAVVVSGCPTLTFLVNNHIRPAVFDAADPFNGNGTDTLYFGLAVHEADVALQLDYFDRYSLKLAACAAPTDPAYSTADLFIRRLAEVPVLDANLTLPVLTGFVFVASPRSIVKSGDLINLVGAAAYPAVVGKYSPAGLTHEAAAYSFGDVVRVAVRFSGAVSLADPQTLLLLADFSRPDLPLYAAAVFTALLNETAALFELLVPPHDDVAWLTYRGQFGLVSAVGSECPVLDRFLSLCAAQNLPALTATPGVNQLADSLNGLFVLREDGLTPLGLSIRSLLTAAAANDAAVIGLDFVNWNAPAVSPAAADWNYQADRNGSLPAFFTGQRLQLVATFSADVVAVGQPRLVLSLDGRPFGLSFERPLDQRRLLFSRPVPAGVSGLLSCGLFCRFEVEAAAGDSSNIFRQTNLPGPGPSGLVPAQLALDQRRCQDAACLRYPAELIAVRPVVLRVFSNETAGAVLAWNDTAHLLVQFSTNIRVVGQPALLLDLAPAFPAASYVGRYDSAAQHFVADEEEPGDSLLFRYSVGRDDNSNALDTLGPAALVFPAGPDQHGQAAGVFLIGHDVVVPADLTLPARGFLGSLGRESGLVIDQSRPFLAAVASARSFVTCGDQFGLAVSFSRPVALIVRDFGLARQLGLTAQQISVRLLHQPSGRNLTANFSHIDGREVFFSFRVTDGLPVGQVLLPADSTIDLRDGRVFSLVGAENGLPCPTTFPRALAAAFSVAVIKAVPRVLAVSSPNVTQLYPFAAGDVLDILVAFDLPVRVEGTASLALALDGGRQVSAAFVSASADGLRLLFRYTLVSGDQSAALEYAADDALVGRILQQSSCETPVAANLTLPAPFSAGSLGDCCRIAVDCVAPYVTALFPVKAPGRFGHREEILVVARFSAPVLVTGTPQLLLATGRPDGQVGVANFTPSATAAAAYGDLLIDFLAADVVFRYEVALEDAAVDLTHNGTAAFRTGPATGEILQFSQTLSHSADLSLREADDFTAEGGRVTRQWMSRLPAKIELLLRDLRHSRPASLSATLDHAGTQALLFAAGCCQLPPDRTAFFGARTAPLYTTATVSTPFALDAAVDPRVTDLTRPAPPAPGLGLGLGGRSGLVAGEDLLFSDSEEENVAGRGLATQSSTILPASLAIDGGRSPLVGDGSTAETFQEEAAWWQLALPAAHRAVQSVLVYERLPESWVTPVVKITLRGLDRYPAGFFKLRFSGLEEEDPAAAVTTKFIPMRASAEVVRAAIQLISAAGTVSVEKKTLPLCAADGSGCGQNFEHGLGDSYWLTFSSIFVAAPAVEVVQLKYPGEPLDDQVVGLDGSTAIFDPPAPILTEAAAVYLSQIYPITTSVVVVRRGYYRPLPKQYAGEAVDLSNSNEWLTPFWLFLFNSSVAAAPGGIPSGLNESKVVAFWKRRVSSVQGVFSVVFPRPYDVAVLKIQREGFGILSLAEVEVYARPLNLLAAYRRGGQPVQPAELNRPYQPHQPLFPLYSAVPFDGRWTLQLSQTAETNADPDAAEFTGAVSEAVLLITDWAGVLRPYYQDLKAVVTSLPRYGQLLVTRPGSLQHFLSWQDRFGLLYSAGLDAIPKAVDSARWLGQCYGDDQNDCGLSPNGRLAHPPELTSSLYGDQPAHRPILRGERAVVFLPDANFTGDDFFSFEIRDGLDLQGGRPNVVRLAVDSCRQAVNFSLVTAPASARVGLDNPRQDEIDALNGFYGPLSGQLCACQSNMTAVLPAWDACSAAIFSVCGQAETRGHFTAVCSACFQQPTGSAEVYTADNFLRNGHCRGNIVRAVSLLYLRGLCARPGVGGLMRNNNNGGIADNAGDGLDAWSRAGYELTADGFVCLQRTTAVDSSGVRRTAYIPPAARQAAMLSALQQP